MVFIFPDYSLKIKRLLITLAEGSPQSLGIGSLEHFLVAMLQKPETGKVKQRECRGWAERHAEHAPNSRTPTLVYSPDFIPNNPYPTNLIPSVHLAL